MNSAMKVGSVLLIIGTILLLTTTSLSAGPADDILFSAESFFKALEDGRYDQVWHLLSAKSRQRIVDDIYRGTLRTGGAADRGRTETEMAQGGSTAVAYWSAFLQNFDPKMALEQSKWELGSIKRYRAEIIITYRKSEHPAILQLFHEGGAWKVGLVETFFVGK